jgi:hypothetical protein
MRVAVHSADSRPENNETRQTDKLFDGLHATVPVKDDYNVLQQCNAIYPRPYLLRMKSRICWITLTVLGTKPTIFFANGNIQVLYGFCLVKGYRLTDGNQILRLQTGLPAGASFWLSAATLL